MFPLLCSVLMLFVPRFYFLFICFQSEYLGEDGEWYFYYTGQEGATYNLTHVFYATEHDRINIAKIQKVSLFHPDG